MYIRLFLALTVCASLSSPVLAHHGWTGYDEGAVTNVTGTIRASSYDNPHATAQVQADGEKGKTWLAILAPPSRMQARGLPKDAIKPGTKTTLVGYPSKTNPDEMRIERMIVNGKTVELR
jgi:hypothetical protein